MSAVTTERRARSRTAAVVACLAALSTLPLFVARIVPGIDYPTHLSLVRVLRAFFEDPAKFRATYETHLFQPYWLSFYAPTLALSALLPLELAGKVVLAAGFLCLPLAVFLLARREGVDPGAAVLATTLLYGFSFFVGLVPFVIGTHLALLALLLVLRFDREGSMRSLLLLHVASVGLVFAHPIAWVMFVAWSGWILLCSSSPRPVRVRRMLTAASALPVPVLVLVFYDRSLRAWSGLVGLRTTPPTTPLGMRAKFFAAVPFTSFAPELEWGLVIALVAVLALSMWGGWDATDRRRLLRFGGLAAMMFAAYFLAPHSAAGVLYFHARLLPFGFAFALLCGSRSPRLPRALVTARIVLALLVISNAFLVFRAFDEEASGAIACLERARPGTKLVGLIPQSYPTIVRYPLFLHLDNYHTALGLGSVMNHLMAMSGPSTPVTYRTPPFHDTRMGLEEHPEWFDYARMGSGVDYFFVHGGRAQLRNGVMVPTDLSLLGAGYVNSTLVCEQGRSRLYEHRAPAPR